MQFYKIVLLTFLFYKKIRERSKMEEELCYRCQANTWHHGGCCLICHYPAIGEKTILSSSPEEEVAESKSVADWTDWAPSKATRI